MAEENKFLEIVDLKKGYGSGETRQEVLRGMTFSVARGEICVLLGPSGSGKSTLLNIIGGIDSADAGFISIGGDKLEDMGEKALTQYRRRHLGYVFQLYNLIANLNVKENIEVGAYLSDAPLDIDEDNVATVITERDITKMADQLDHSMGSYMTYFQYLCVLLSAVLIYLLTKLIMEKNENAISMVKILGYENREIARLYLLSTTIVLVLIDAVSVWLGAAAMKLAWREIMFSYSGWFAFHMEPAGYVKMFVFVLLGYAIVTIFDFRRIRKIPMDEALKSAE